ncbi:hypothetical protein CICLE_v10006525mg [Citrus x clementina]|uniref:Glutamyl-tRNA(Gln) amidotransferase subunit B n=5 Tax=Citrus TaxID=2706 RepID=A0ACB8I3J8_CITSI|nr:uncharacterized protein LOC18032859 [Citrus x clementina]XP_006480266.1 uncharacterized protein LOC102622579 [Citrus sinensis]GAY46600.1 hypothetical protein CUMW_098320 [Citrus unshiu]ESR33626.1 hypothetical protein CICLE_v10006525mg [Citrus x clementina]KAH9681608.1 glutamyl-tRNA(Gln) amidotransferase subunit B [Citrus sinensis]KDO52267.1 hypothetical protein CISIN_1g045490mg [Citrus sinensis]
MEAGTPQSRKVMVIADPTRESAGALQYALSHVLLEEDELVLLHVDTPNSWKNPFITFLRKPSNSQYTTPASLSSSSEGAAAPGGEDFLEEMKQACEVAKPKLRVHVEKVHTESGNKAAIILSQSTAHGVDLLIIGQRRSLSNAILGYRRAGGSLRGSKGVDTAEYLIQNSKCNCVGVQRKGQNAGYLLNTKTYRNFWLLA